MLVVDGSFLQRGELAGRWDEAIFLDTSLDVARARGVRRDPAAFGGAEQAGRAYDSRYHAACRRYLEWVDPITRASIVVGNDDLACPVLSRMADDAPRSA